MSERILLVESESSEIELISLALAESGITNPVDVVRSGEECVDYLYKRGKYADRVGHYPIVIFLDLKLPGMDGKQLVKILKETEFINCIPIVVLTGSDYKPDIIAGYALGANSYVKKPVDSKAFFETVKSIGLYWTVTSSPPPVEQCKIL